MEVVQRMLAKVAEAESLSRGLLVGYLFSFQPRNLIFRPTPPFSASGALFFQGHIKKELVSSRVGVGAQDNPSPSTKSSVLPTPPCTQCQL